MTHLVQSTNDDSTASKIRAIARGYWNDPYLRLFEYVATNPLGELNAEQNISQHVGVSKYGKSNIEFTATSIGGTQNSEQSTHLNSISRPLVSARGNSPVMNRGYWLRTMAVHSAVSHFLKNHSTQCQVVNFGCGYDTLFFALLEARERNKTVTNMEESHLSSHESPLPDGVCWVDVDFKEVLDKKKEILQRSETVLALLLKNHVRICEASAEVTKDQDFSSYTSINNGYRNETDSEFESHKNVKGTSLIYLSLGYAICFVYG